MEYPAKEQRRPRCARTPPRQVRRHTATQVQKQRMRPGRGGHDRQWYPDPKANGPSIGVKMSQGQGTLLLYPDKLAHVHSQAIRWATGIGFVVVAVPSFALPPHTGPGLWEH